MAPKSIYRHPGAQHFQLVHRSQRDPLIHDPEASTHVLKPFQRENDVKKKGKSRTDLEALLAPEELAARPNAGEASLYGVYFDDTEYDYMQHLRETGVEEDGVETIMIEAPVSKKKGKSKAREVELRLPPEVLPSAEELDKPQAYDAQQAVPDALAGFQPDMDPHLRQVLEALEDDAFVDEGLEEDFFGELVREGERGAEDAVVFEFREEGVGEGDEEGRESLEADDEPWEARFARFKRGQENVRSSEADASDVGGDSEGVDTVGRLPVIGGKRRRQRGGSESSGFSMTSSAVFRNEGLTTLDERYDQIEKFYDEDDEIPDDDDENEESDSDEAPDLLEVREGLEAVMDDFLANYELVGRRMQPVLQGDTAAEKLDTIRRALGSARLYGDDDGDDDDGSLSIPMPHDIDEPKDRWDCETILSTYTNLENHPRLIRARDNKRVTPIRLDPRTGMPSVQDADSESKRPRPGGWSDQDRSTRVTTARPRDESKEDRKARKQAVKQERQARRVEKKATRDQFVTERKNQVKAHAHKPLNTKKL